MSLKLRGKYFNAINEKYENLNTIFHCVTKKIKHQTNISCNPILYHEIHIFHIYLKGHIALRRSLKKHY